MVDRLLGFFCLTLYLVAASVGLFTGGLWASLAIGGALILGAVLWVQEKRFPLPSQGFLILVAAALGLFALELPLSSHIALSLHVWLQLASIFLPLLLLTAPRLQAAVMPKSFILIVALTACIGAFALQLELESGGFLLHLKKPTANLTEYNRGLAYMVILVFPLFAGLWSMGRKEQACLLALIFFFPAGLTESHTAKLALIGGGACVAAAAYRPQWVRKGLTLLSVFLMGWPFYAQVLFSNAFETVEGLPSSWRHRVGIWDYLSYRIAERPVFGWGLGTTHRLDFLAPHGYLYADVGTAAPHAHNFVVALWVETGIIGLALGLAFLLLSLRAASRLHASLRPFAYGSWLAAVIVSLFGFDFWTDSLWSAFALTGFAFGMLQQKLEREHNLIDA